MLVSIGSYDLCDGTFSGGFAASDIRLRFTRGIEVVQAIGGLIPVTIDRLTRRLDLSFTVHRVHSSINAAEIFIGNHDTTVPRNQAIKLTTTGSSTIFILSGFLTDIQLINQTGAKTSHSYRIVGGVFDEHPPRPATLNQVINTGTAIGLWPTMAVPTPTTLTEVIDAGTTLGLWPSGPVPVTPATLNQVIAAGTALDLWL